MQDRTNALHSVFVFLWNQQAALAFSYLGKQIANITNICANIPKASFYKRAKFLTQTIPNMLHALLLIEISPDFHFSINEKTTATKAL